LTNLLRIRISVFWNHWTHALHSSHSQSRSALSTAGPRRGISSSHHAAAWLALAPPSQAARSLLWLLGPAAPPLPLPGCRGAAPVAASAMALGGQRRPRIGPAGLPSPPTPEVPPAGAADDLSPQSLSLLLLLLLLLLHLLFLFLKNFPLLRAPTVLPPWQGLERAV
jgi:hypothetical protein